VFSVNSNRWEHFRASLHSWYRLAVPAILLPVIIATAACTSQSAEEADLRKILTDQLARYPRMEVQDLYKFLHQAAMGSEHAVRDTAMARDWLRREIANLDSVSVREPLMEPLSPDGQLVRVNLRPYLESGGKPEALLRAFVRTANEYPGEPATLERYWLIAEAMCSEGELPFLRTEMESFFAARRDQGFPAVHHSEDYGQLYRPAYRVIQREFLQPDHEVRE
jgi:hypothetical protein